MKLVCISDTHTKHPAVQLPMGDVLIHAGDVSWRGRQREIELFIAWFSAQPHPHKVLIAGNHDYFFERSHSDTIRTVVGDNIHYLQDSGVEIGGLQFWGSPVQPWFHDWAFNRERGADIRRHWDLIPNNTDVLVVHGPPHGILDTTIYKESVGCEDLLARVQQVKPKLCVFGHIHEAYGQQQVGDTLFVNASQLDVNYDVGNTPVVVEL